MEIIMNTQGLADVVKEFSPTVATVLAGVNPVAAVVFECVAKLFGVATSNPVDVAAAVASDPDAKIKLKEFELRHAELLEQSLENNYKTEVQDRMDARKMASSNKDWVMHFLAIGYMLGFFTYIIVPYFSLVAFDKGIFHDLLNVAMLVFSFYFGSSYKQNK